MAAGPGGGRGDAAESQTGTRPSFPWVEGREGFDVSPDGKEIWAANAQDGTISIIDVASKKVTDTVSANVTGANRLKFTPDGKRVLVSSLRLPDLAIFDAATRKESEADCRSAAARPDSRCSPTARARTSSCTPDDYVAVIDLTSQTVVAHIDAGKQPDGLAGPFGDSDWGLTHGALRRPDRGLTPKCGRPRRPGV